jgi:hypothetical protein
VAELCAHLLDLLLQQQERRIVTFFPEQGSHPAQKNPSEENQNQN